MYIFANSTRLWIPARIADSVEQNGEYTLTFNVTDGTLHLGMTAVKPGTNWHSMQIKSLDRIPYEDMTVGDVNGDGRVDISDVITLLGIIAAGE